MSDFDFGEKEVTHPQNPVELGVIIGFELMDELQGLNPEEAPDVRRRYVDVLGSLSIDYGFLGRYYSVVTNRAVIQMPHTPDTVANYAIIRRKSLIIGRLANYGYFEINQAGIKSIFMHFDNPDLDPALRDYLDTKGVEPSWVNIPITHVDELLPVESHE